MRFKLLLLLFPLAVSAQTPRQLEKILEQTDKGALLKMSVDFHQEYEIRKIKIENYLKLNPDVRFEYVDNGVEYRIYDIENNKHVYAMTSNRGSSLTARANRLYQGGSLGLSVQGQGMTVYVWDGGLARDTHVEFPNNKVVNVNFSTTTSSHATHVTGTIVAQGITPSIKGIAFDAGSRNYDWDNDYSEISSVLNSTGMLVSNHSYIMGPTGTWTFGAYDARARQLDQIIYAAPYYLFVGAAGNDRNEYTDPVVGPYLSQKYGYNLIRGMHNSKNSLTVGAVNQVNNYTGPNSVVMSDFSSWGPTDDGRIKPDIVAKGTNVRSTYNENDTDNAISQGTSMASPAVAGVALLLQQHYSDVNEDEFMKAATLKGLILHTADEAGVDKGPDYIFGWGLINAERAAQVITSASTNTNIIHESVLNAVNNSYIVQVYATGNEPLVASISWMDRAGSANNGVVDPESILLVNDLDLRIIKNNEVYYPWTLDPSNPIESAQRNQDNFRDNFEKVEIDMPLQGYYTVQVTHKGSLTGGQQPYSLIVSGINQTLSNLSFHKNDLISIFPNPANSQLNFTNDNFEVNAISILDISGKIINTHIDLIDKKIDVSELQSGVYFVKFHSEGDSVMKRFLKK